MNDDPLTRLLSEAMHKEASCVRLSRQRVQAAARRTDRRRLTTRVVVPALALIFTGGGAAAAINLVPQRAALVPAATPPPTNPEVAEPGTILRVTYASHAAGVKDQLKIVWTDLVTGASRTENTEAGAFVSGGGTTVSDGIATQTFITDARSGVYFVNREYPAVLGLNEDDRADTLRARVANGLFTVHGSAVVDGRQTVKLVGQRNPWIGITDWVDPKSYQIVRQVAELAGTRGQTDYAFLSRTPGNRALTHFVVPPGFRRVAAPPPGMGVATPPTDSPSAPSGGTGQGS